MTTTTIILIITGAAILGAIGFAARWASYKPRVIRVKLPDHIKYRYADDFEDF